MRGRCLEYYKSKDAQLLFEVSSETVRNYVKEFATYLSPTANPGKGSHRLFTPDDLAVFALIVDMKRNQGRPFEEIHAALVNGQRGELPDLTRADIIAIDFSRRGLDAIEILRNELEEAKKREAQLVAQVIELKQKPEALQQTIISLEAQKGELRRQNERQEQRISELTQQMQDAFERGFGRGFATHQKDEL